MAPVNPDDFKGALGSWAAGVTVVTTRHNGLVYGITASSFSSLSLDPLLVLVCIARSNHLADLVPQSGRYAVTVLAEGQDEISNWFAISGRDPVPAYDEFDTFELETGSPLIRGGIAHLDCELEDALPGGDHIIAVGRVVAASFDPGARPLVYFRRGYRRLLLD
ncbi:MAG: flavin reductase family protein [Dehalococcoidia bacterium]